MNVWKEKLEDEHSFIGKKETIRLEIRKILVGFWDLKTVGPYRQRFLLCQITSIRIIHLGNIIKDQFYEPRACWTLEKNLWRMQIWSLPHCCSSSGGRYSSVRELQREGFQRGTWPRARGIQEGLPQERVSELKPEECTSKSQAVCGWGGIE